MFNEKTIEKIYENGQMVDLPVWQSPKYLESREFAIKLINENKYNLRESDFWILMNKTKNGKMAYTGLIISHNGCLKINNSLTDELKFKSECLSRTDNAYKNSLIYEYNCQEQGLYEVGEVSASNCKNEYPFAMAFKRCFDRVVLKNSTLAFAGIYSDSEADEFAEKLDNVNTTPKPLSELLMKQIIDLKIDLVKLAKYNNVSVDSLTDEMLKTAIEMKNEKIREIDVC